MIGVFGDFQLHSSVHSATTWEALQSTADIGSMELVLATAVGWELGSTIIITSTEYTVEESNPAFEGVHRQEETRRVTGVSGNTITLDKPLEHRHFSGVIPGTHGATLTAHVGLISRSIVVAGHINPQYYIKQYGLHIVVDSITYAKTEQCKQITLTGSMQAVGVEFRDMAKHNSNRAAILFDFRKKGRWLQGNALPTTIAKTRNVVRSSSIDSWGTAIVAMETEGIEIVGNVVSRSYDLGIDIDTQSTGGTIDSNLLTNNRRSPASYNKFCMFDDTCAYQPHAVLHLWNYNLKSVKNNVVAGTDDVGIMMYTLDSCDDSTPDVFANNEVYGATRGFHVMEHIEPPTSPMDDPADRAMCSSGDGQTGVGSSRDCARLANLQAQGCIFPFVYDGESYAGCTTVDNDGVPWCALKDATAFDPKNREHRHTCPNVTVSNTEIPSNDTCTRKIEGIKAWKNSHCGVYMETTMPGLLFKHVFVADNHIGLATVGVWSGWKNAITIKHSIIAGSTPASTCDASTDCRAATSLDVRGIGCNSVFGSKWRRIGLMLPQFNGLQKNIAANPSTAGLRRPMQVKSMCSLPFEKRYSNLNKRLHQDTLQGMNMHLDLRLVDVTFIFFKKDDCGKRSQAIALAPDQPDLSPTLHMSEIKWHETTEATARLSLLDGLGTAMKMLLVNDLDGSTMASGLPGQLLPSWHDIYPHNSVVTAEGFADSTENCDRHQATHSVQCSHLHVRHVIFEPLDAGRGMSIGPVTARKINWNSGSYATLQKANYRSSQTAVEVTAERCAKVPGFSRFELMLAPGNEYKINTRAAMPGTMRLTLPFWSDAGADPHKGMILRFFYQQPFALKVYANGREIMPLPRQTVFNINEMQKYHAGDHTFNPQTRYLTLVVKGSAQEYQMIVQQQIQVTEALQMTPQQFYCDDNLDKFVSTMQRLLGKTKVAVVCVTPPGGACIKPREREQTLGCRRWRKRRSWSRRQRQRRQDVPSRGPAVILARAGNTCPAGYRKAASDVECKIASWTAGPTSSAVYRGDIYDARLPSGCFWSPADGAYFNSHAQGQVNAGRRPYCFKNGFVPKMTTSTALPTTMALTPAPSADVFLASAGNACPMGYTTVTAEHICQVVVELLAMENTATPNYVGTENSSDWPFGCYYCHGGAGCGESSAWFNSHATGMHNAGARVYCTRDGFTPAAPSTRVCGGRENYIGRGRCNDCGWTDEPCCTTNNTIAGGSKCTLDADECSELSRCVPRGSGGAGSALAASLGNFEISTTAASCKNVLKLSTVAANKPAACLAEMDGTSTCSGYAFSFSHSGACTCALDKCIEVDDDEYSFDVYKPVVEAADFDVEYQMTPTAGKGDHCFTASQGQDYRGRVATARIPVPYYTPCFVPNRLAYGRSTGAFAFVLFLVGSTARAHSCARAVY